MFYVQLAPLGGSLGPLKSDLGLFLPFLAFSGRFGGLNGALEVQVEDKTCRTIHGTHLEGILSQKNLTGLAGGVREGQNMAQNGPRICKIFGFGALNLKRP